MMMTTSSSTYLNKTQIFENSSGSSGGAVAVVDNANPFIEHSRIMSNTGNNGVGVYCTDSANVTLSNVILKDHVAPGSTGGIYASNNASVYLNDCILQNNLGHALGGALHLQDFVSASLNRCSFRVCIVFTTSLSHKVQNNSASEGGAIYTNSRGSELQISDSLFSGNYAEYVGGSITLQESSSANIRNSVFHDNYAQFGGSFQMQDHALCLMQQCTMYNSNCLQYGGALAVLGFSSLSATTVTLRCGTKKINQ